ncbi:hypothetical protein CHN50_13290 [Priestia aryabhattai]|uniref:hypothetical protein n=1 Tax=Priestia TaxID=2800373 RepID=UPI000BA18CC6|nr:hypothetical protein [Priestia flexa]MDT2046013.1 hypothetical protein [Priestia flexa]OZT11876.1 hypothetical protein CHN50_13290 [Priestia aryabhattai]USY53952.1 hypothetical protein NIZ91_14470 [Bacillus sp. 1780r2a1]
MVWGVVLVGLFIWCSCYYTVCHHGYISTKAGNLAAVYTAMSTSFITAFTMFVLVEETLMFSSVCAACAGIGVGWFIAIPFTVKTIIGSVVSGTIASFSFYTIHVFWSYSSEFLWAIFILISLVGSSQALFKILKEIPMFESVFVKRCIQHPLVLTPIFVLIFFVYQFIERYMPQYDPTRKT